MIQGNSFARSLTTMISSVAIRRILKSSYTLAGTGVFARFWVVSSRGGGSSNVLFKELTLHCWLLMLMNPWMSFRLRKNVLDADDNRVSRDIKRCRKAGGCLAGKLDCRSELQCRSRRMRQHLQRDLHTTHFLSINRFDWNPHIKVKLLSAHPTAMITLKCHSRTQGYNIPLRIRKVNELEPIS